MGYCNVRHTRKDLHNQIDTTRRSLIVDSNAESSIAYFFAKSETNPGFFFIYTVDDENRLCNLFWPDSKSQDDFHFFGDVIAFDSTYRTNVYKKPFIIFVGTNHHWKTIVFGFGLLIGETVEKYTWLLETFLLAMEGKKPKSIITDGDKAMRKALKKVMLESVLRLCCWHLERNA
ncbi:hypothetical protein Dsin_026951 [Dipteronia sinensis]|uniref:MULE transposase domain-containing protein n=1 Tax=Dipteronia sinensis TaxID=43782 RepID=A0AAD9ZYU8_9ROSI|nr:hypothetical protein Dsin_026951 [Dipteronia sinensis]